ncbi:MAG: M48 family metalloprotease [Gammaproteobacteria bacterium]|nr:M48 family metalloprotease [Gammaproteobacteria bacterium]
MRTFSNILYVACGLSITLLIGSCSVNPVTGKNDLVLMSESQEIQSGQQYHQQIINQYGIYNNPVLQRYVNRVGQELAAQSHRATLAFHFTVLDSPEINAFALPGGYVYITRGIMAYLNSEAELAGVLGHEIGHVTARHGVRQQTTNAATSVFAQIVSAKTNAAWASDVTQLLGGALVSGYGREHELEADRLGAEYIARTGYDPQNMLNVISLLKNQETYQQQRARAEGKPAQSYHGLFSTHPANDQRLQTVIAAAKQFQKPGQNRDINRDAYLKAIDGLNFGDDAASGAVRNNIFYHTGLNIGFKLPAQWPYQNTAEYFIVAAPDKKAILQLSVSTSSQTPEQFLRAQIKDAPIIAQRSLSINNLSAHEIRTQSATEQGVRPIHLTVIRKNQQLFLFAISAANDAALQTYQAQLKNTVADFHTLNDAERKSAQSYKVVLEKANANTSYAALAKKSLLKEDAVTQLRLINGDYPNGEITTARFIKLIK